MFYDTCQSYINAQDALRSIIKDYYDVIRILLSIDYDLEHAGEPTQTDVADT